MRTRAYAVMGLLSVWAQGCGGELVVTGSGAGGAGGAGGSGGAGGAGGIQIEGLSAPIEALYDPNGLLHVTCAEDDDCYAALGYLHASNRFFFMDFIRNLVRGRLGSLVQAGSVVLEVDFENRRFFSTVEGEPLERKLYDDASDQVKGHFEAYARGVNAWIADMRDEKNGATLTPEYDYPLIVKSAIRDWEVEDSAAVGLYVLNDLSNNADGELLLGTLATSSLPANLQADLLSPKPVFEGFTTNPPAMPFEPLPPPSGSGVSSPLPPPFTQAHAATLAPLLRQARASMSKVGWDSSSKGVGNAGSNNWVVGPSKSASGNALLANDPHLPLSNPSIWFAVELDAVSSGSGAYHVAGSTFPGLPSIMIGNNENVAWGVTTAYYDLADVYVEELNADGTAVIVDGVEQPIVERDFEFADVSTGTPVTRTFRWSVHGPIVSEDRAAGTAIAIRWRAHEGGTDLESFFGLARAANLEEARLAIENTTSASQNFVVIDREGNIGWFPYIQVPQRPWASAAIPPWLPVPGDGSAEWGPPVPLDEVPQLENPSFGYIATANADMTGASADGDLLSPGDTKALQLFGAADGARARRIMDVLEASDAHTSESMVELQGDHFSLYGTAFKQAFIDAGAAAALPPEQQEIVDALTAWTGTCPTGTTGDPKSPTLDADPVAASESIGCAAFHAVFIAAVHTALADERDAADLDTLGGYDRRLVARALLDPTSITSGELFWDDVSTVGMTETRTDTLRAALALAANVLALSGDTPDAWRWGLLHTVTLRSIFDNFGIQDFNEGAYAAPGGLETVNVANPRVALPEDGDPFDFGFRSAASIRVVVEFTEDGPQIRYQLPGGNDLARESPFYNNLLPGWLANEPILFPFGPGAVTDPAAVVNIVPKP